MASMFIPIIVLFIIIYGFKKNIAIYEKFLIGVEEGLRMALKIFPTMFAMTICINVILKSNIINDIVNLFEPLFRFLNYPKELISLAIMRPLSGSSSLVIMDNILKTNGPDTFIGRVASVLQGSSDTTIYIISLYFSSVGIKKIKYSLIVGLLADLMAVIFSIITIRLLFHWKNSPYYRLFLDELNSLAFAL